MPKAKSTVFPGRPKIVYLAHPVRGNVSQNVQSILKLCDEIHSEETIPFAPYLQYLQYLNDAVDADRQKGILAEKPFFVRKAMDEVWLCGERISEGMKLEIEWSLELGIPIKCHNPLLEPELEKIIQKNRKKLKKTNFLPIGKIAFWPFFFHFWPFFCQKKRFFLKKTENPKNSKSLST